MCLSAIFSLFRRGKKSKYILDGPGMENPFAWDSFSVSRSGDSYAQHNFFITVKYCEDRYAVSGTILDYVEEEGIVLPKKACREIDALQPQYLPDSIRNSSSGIADEGLMILDAPNVQIEVEYTDGRLQEKVDDDDFSIKVFNIIWPYFEKKFG